jgi:hypothetical protein
LVVGEVADLELIPAEVVEVLVVFYKRLIKHSLQGFIR